MDLLLSLLPWILGGGGGLVLIVLAIGFLGGWSLLLNRYVLGAIAVAVLAIAVAAWWANEKAALRAEGRQALEEANKKAAVERRRAIAEYVSDLSARNTELDAKVRGLLARIDADQLDRERNPHVSKAADAACPIPRGFVRDVDAALPGAAGRAAVPDGGAGVDVPTGIPLSVVAREVGRNYAQCSKLLADRDAAEEKRYTACLEWDRKFGTHSNCSRGGAQQTPINPGSTSKEGR